MKKALLISILTAIFCDKAFTQEKSYRYIVEKKLFLIDSIYKCIESEFGFKRHYYSDTEFSDFSYYNRGRDTIARKMDSFKVINGTWYIKRNRRWKYFFSNTGFHAGKTTLSCYFLTEQPYLFPYKIIKDSIGRELYIYQLNPKKQIDKLYYVFDPNIGFISIDIGDCKLILSLQ